MALNLSPILIIALYLFPSAAIISSAYLIAHAHPFFGTFFLIISILSLPLWRH